VKALFQRGLVALAARRTAGLGIGAWTLALAVLIACADWSPPPAWLDESRSERANELLRAGLVRQGAWITFLAALAPVLVHRAASRAAAWRRKDGAWLASRAVSARTIFASTWAGATLASLACALVFALIGEVRGGSSAGAARLAARLDGPGAHWIEQRMPFEWHVDLPAELASSAETASGEPMFVRIDLGLGAGAGAACEVNLRARRAGGAWSPITSAHIGNRGSIEIAIPTGTGALDLELSTPSEEARVLLFGERCSVWRTTSGAFSVGAPIFTRVVIALAAWHALALAFSTWMSAASATWLVVALWVTAWWSNGATSEWIAASLPGADLFDAIAIAAEGRAPAPAGWHMLDGLVVILLASLWIGVLGLRKWKVAR
jgi:hypothetical protein